MTETPAPPADTWEAVSEYIGDGHPPHAVVSAYAAEVAAQAKVCRAPRPDEDTADLTEALCRRVAANLANRSLPLGVQAMMTDSTVATNRVGGIDREVGRLERPWRKLVMG